MVFFPLFAFDFSVVFAMSSLESITGHLSPCLDDHDIGSKVTKIKTGERVTRKKETAGTSGR